MLSWRLEQIVNVLCGPRRYTMGEEDGCVSTNAGKQGIMLEKSIYGFCWWILFFWDTSAVIFKSE